MAGISGKITITASQEGQGLLISLATDGNYADETIDRRFYSIPELPESELQAAEFWAPILIDIGRFLGTG